MLQPFQSDGRTGTGRLRRSAGARLCAGLLSVLLLAGCVERRLMIRSEPPGAVVYVGKREVGVTPVGVNFTYYGAREIILVKDGFETLTDVVEIPPPWYEIPPLDYISETLVPTTWHDYRTLTYRLQPRYMVPTPELRGRAEQLRQSGRSGGQFFPPPSGPQPGP